MAHRTFTEQEIESLEALPAVAHASASRIVYSHEFQLYCMHRYLHGEKPSVIFASVGLPSRLIGYKRIERAINRWKRDSNLMWEAKMRQETTDFSADLRNTMIQDNYEKIRMLNERLTLLERQLEALQAVRKDEKP